MKLKVFPPRQGLTWFRLGVHTFFRQPLALSGLFFLFMGLTLLVNQVPFVGSALAVSLLPAATVGLMIATQEAAAGKFPMPMVLFRAFRAGRQKARSTLMLSGLYALGFFLVLGGSAVVDGGEFAKLYLQGGDASTYVLNDKRGQGAALFTLVLYGPLSLLFWHAPALVHWHGLSPAKSLFFSAVACGRNLGAFLVYCLAWAAFFMLVSTAIAVLTLLSGNEAIAAAALFPCALVLASMFFTSIYFTFADSFAPDAAPPN